MIYRRYRLMIMMVAMLALACSPLKGVVAQESQFPKPSEITNAALLYWQSFALLPKLDKEQLKSLDKIEVDKDINKDIQKILEECQNSFELIDPIHPDTKCRWELLQSGPLTMLPHLGKARTLAKLLVIQGRFDWAIGNEDAAMKRFSQALLIGRNVGDGPLVCMLVSHIVEQLVMDAVNQRVESISPAIAAAFIERLDAMPARTTLANAMTIEKQLTEPWIKELVVNQTNSSSEALAEIFPNPRWVKTILSGSEVDRRANCEELAKFYDELISIAGGSSETMDAELEQWNQEVKQAKNAITAGVLPSTIVFERYREATDKWNDFEKVIRNASK